MEHALTLPPSLARRAAEAPDATLRLTPQATFARQLPAGACIAVQAGCIWLTQAGDANDYFVAAGQFHVVTRPGRVVIETFTPQAAMRVLLGAPASRPGFP
jgi:Protein of unknown function (DUF2917)